MKRRSFFASLMAPLLVPKVAPVPEKPKTMHIPHPCSLCGSREHQTTYGRVWPKDRGFDDFTFGSEAVGLTMWCPERPVNWEHYERC